MSVTTATISEFLELLLQVLLMYFLLIIYNHPFTWLRIRYKRFTLLVFTGYFFTVNFYKSLIVTSSAVNENIFV